MENLKIYGINVGAIAFSLLDGINPMLQTISLILAIIYTAINIYKKL